MPLELDNQQFNNYNDPEPLFQNWGNPLLAEVYFNPNYVLIPPFLALPIKDFINVPEYSQYSQFRIQVFQYSTFVNHLPLTGMPTNPFVLTNNGLILTTIPLFQNLNLLEDGTHEHTYAIEVRGFVNGAWQYITGFSYVLRLIKSSINLIWSPQNFAITHQQGLPFQWHNINIDGPSWKLSSNANLILDSDDVDVAISQLPGSLGYLATGSGAKVVKFRLSNYYDTGTPDPSTLNQIINVILGNSSQAGFINVNINILVNGFIFTNTTSLSFIGYKGILEPLAQFVGISAAIAPVLSVGLPWLTIVPATSPSGIFPFQNGFDVKPIASSNMVPGIYTGTIRFYVVNNDPTYFPIGEYSRTINITYQLFGDIVSPYDNEKIGLTLTSAYYEFFAENQNTYFDMTLHLKVNDFQGMQTTKIINLKVALFEQKAKEFLGKIIHRLMAMPVLQSQINYKPAELIIEVVERDVITHEEKRSFSSTVQKFVAGFNEPRNGNIFLDSQILNINRKPKRIYKNQYYFLSWYQDGLSNPIIDVRINGVDVTDGGDEIIDTPFSNLINIQNVICKSINVNMDLPFGPNQADVLEFKIYQNPDNLPFNEINFEPEQIETLICFPEPKQWNEIIWVDEFKLFKNFIFGGEFSIESDKEFISNRNYNGIFEILENIDLNNIKKIKINTGWMLKSDAETIDSLINSQKVFLVKQRNFEVQEKLELTPISKKIIHENSTDMTIEMTVEFEITPTR